MPPRERPILMSAPMVRRTLDGSKTQTRRIVKLLGADCVEERWESEIRAPMWPFSPQHDDWIACPYGAPGDRLWVRETWCPRSNGALLMEKAQRPFYAATDGDGDMPKPAGWPWRPSIHMPRWASRIVLEVTEVRVERLHALTEDDARAEGVTPLPLQHGEPGCWWTADVSAGPALHARTARDAFRLLWDAINGERAPWASNPWVFVVAYRRVA